MPRSVSLALLLAIPLVAASHVPDCAPSTSRPEVDSGGTAAGRYYYDCDWVLAAIPCVTYAYLYEESNGIDGLQRNDETNDDTCHGAIPADTLVW